MAPPTAPRSQSPSNQDTHNDTTTTINHKDSVHTDVWSAIDRAKSSLAARKPSSATHSTTHSTESSSRRPSSFRTRLVKLDDDQLAKMAHDTKSSIDWRAVVLSARVGPARWRRQETSTTAKDFAVYTRQEQQRYGVLAVGLVPGCVAEIVNVMQSQNSAQYRQQMEDIYEDQFKEGTLVHTVDTRDHAVAPATTPTTARSEMCDGSELRELTVKTLAFSKSGWFAEMEEWCYVDALYRNAASGVVEKFMKTLQPSDIVAGLSKSNNTKYFHDVVCGYLFRPGANDLHDEETSNQEEDNHEEPAASTASSSTEAADQQAAAQAKATNVTRVSFYAEFQVAKQLGFSLVSSTMGTLDASEKTIKQRLLKLGESTQRITALVRRQRLGMQTLVDIQRFLPPTNTPCMVCTRILRVAKLCRLCGQGVCGDCSAKHERVTHPRGSDQLHVAKIRVCANCMVRVDHATYKNLSCSSLLGSHIIPNPNNSSPPSSVLKDLLHDALVNAPSPSRKACVISVIQNLLELEASSSSDGRGSSSASSWAGSDLDKSESYYLDALGDMDIECLSLCDADIRCDDQRTYQLDMRGDPDSVLPAPIPADEEARLVAVRRVSLSELGELAELSIICDVAAQEMGCSTSTISIIDHTTLQVVASNVDALKNLVVPRQDSLCSHTIMENKAHIICHPEADIRFNKIASVDQFVQYYCAFPLVGDDDHIIGSICCINQESLEITEAQFATFKKLAATASKVVRVQTDKSHRKMSAASTMSSDATQ